MNRLTQLLTNWGQIKPSQWGQVGLTHSSPSGDKWAPLTRKRSTRGPVTGWQRRHRG